MIRDQLPGEFERGLAAEIFETRDEHAAFFLVRLSLAEHRADFRRKAGDAGAITELAAGAEDGERRDPGQLRDAAAWFG